MICPKCGHKNEVDADFCENCGTKLKKTVDNKHYTNNSSRRVFLEQLNY